MPGVVAFVGASILGGIGVGAASAALIMGVGSAAIALTVASARRAAKLDDPADAGYSVGQQVSIRSTEAPRNIVYGEANVGGVFTYVNSAGSELRSLYYELVHTGHEIDSFVGWYIDEKYIPVADVDTAGDGSVDTNTGGHDLDDVAAGPVLYLRGHLGTAAQTVDSMLDSAFTDIGSNHRHRGCAKSVIRCDLLAGNEDKWNGRPPASITAVVRGMLVYDPRLDSTFPGGSGSHRLATPSTWEWSDNPALIWANYRTLARPLGPGWDTDRIDWQSVFDAADDCDALADIPTATTEARFRCDLVVDAAMEPREVVSQILATMAGSERHFGGQWHVYAGVWPTPDFTLDEDDLVGPVQYRKQPDTASQDRYNQVKGEYHDRDRLWKLSPFLTASDTSLRDSRDNGRTMPKHLRLEGVSREYQAQRLALRALRQAEDSGILIFPAGYSAANIRVGDTGTVTIDEFGWSSKTFRCVGIKAIDFVGYELTLKEDESVNYDDPEEGEYSTRSAAGEISFGTVLPWYLQPGTGFWTPVLVNVSRNGQEYTKTGGADSTWGDASVYSIDGYARLHVGFTALATTYDVVVGYDSNPSASHSWDTIDACWNLDSGGDANVIESGSTVLADGAYAVGDRFSIVRDYSSVRYYKNGVLRHTTFITPTAALRYLDSSFYGTGDAIGDLTFGPIETVGTGQLDPNAAEVLVSSQPADGTEVLASISYSGGGTLVDYSPITSVSWENDTGESIDVVLRQSARVQLSASDSLIGRKLAMRWSLNGGSSWSYDGTNTDNVNISAADWQPKATQVTVTVADGETIDVESIVVLVIPDPTTGDPADVQYRGLSLSIEAKLR